LLILQVPGGGEGERVWLGCAACAQWLSIVCWRWPEADVVDEEAAGHAPLAVVCCHARLDFFPALPAGHLGVEVLALHAIVVVGVPSGLAQRLPIIEHMLGLCYLIYLNYLSQTDLSNFLRSGIDPMTIIDYDDILPN
jgi:hypothetical protein